MVTAPAPRHRADRLADGVRTGEAGRLSPLMVQLLATWLGPFLRLAFRPRMEGWDNLPADRPFLVVANHSGGGLAECVCLAMLWLGKFGPNRMIAGMAHPGAFYIPGPGQVLRGLGAIPATYRHAQAAFAKGLPVIVFPGGDYEAFRPIWKANEVDFAGRQGFLRLAREANVPIVPLGIRGSHYTAPVLWRSRLLPILLIVPRLVGAKYMGVTLLLVVGLVAIFAWAPSPTWMAALTIAWATNAGAYWLPIVPWTIRARLGAPLEPDALFDQDLDVAYDRVVAAVQRLVDR